MKNMQSTVKKLSKVVKLDLPYYMAGSFWLSLSRFVTAALSLLLSVLFARFTPEAFYGQYKFALSIFSLLAILALPGMDQAISQSVARGFSRSVMHGVRSKIQWSLGACPVLLAIAIYFLSFKDDDLGWAFLISAPLFPLAQGFANNAFFAGRRRFKETGLFFICRRLVSVALVAGAIFLMGDIISVVTAYLVAIALVNIIVFLYIAREIKGEPDTDDGDLVRYGKNLTAMDIFVSVAQSLDNLLIASFLGFQEVAIFAIAQSIPEAVKGSFKQLASLTLPKFAATEAADVYKKLRVKFTQLLGVGLFAMLALIVALPFLIPAVYTTKYAASVLPAEILAISVLLSPLRQAVNSALVSQKRTKELYYLNFLTPGCRIILLLTLIPLIGVSGAALSYAIARTVGIIYAWHAVKNMARETEANRA